MLMTYAVLHMSDSSRGNSEKNCITQFSNRTMSDSVGPLASLLESLSTRVAELESRAGIAPPAASSGGAKSGGIDTSPTSVTRDFDVIVAKFGAPLVKAAEALNDADAKVLVSGSILSSLV